MNGLLIICGVSMLMQTGGPGDAGGQVAEKMKALSFLVGEWEGEGKMQMGPQPAATAKVTESVRMRLSGKAMLIEGLGIAEGKPVHEALALITWNPKKNDYEMHAMTARAGHVAPTLEVGDKSLVWSFDTQVGGKVRFTIKINEKGQWSEIGEFSQDGSTWNKFFEMLLTKKN